MRQLQPTYGTCVYVIYYNTYICVSYARSFEKRYANEVEKNHTHIIYTFKLAHFYDIMFAL